MDLICKVSDKFVVSDDGIKVVLDVDHGEGVLDFLHSVGGMDCNIYVQVSERAPKNESPAAVQDEDQRDMFEGNGEPVGISATQEEREGIDEADPLDMPEQRCLHDLALSECEICSTVPVEATAASSVEEF